MAYPASFQAATTTANNERGGKFSITGVILPYGYAPLGGTSFKTIGTFCNDISINDIPIEEINGRDVSTNGKNIVHINEGFSITAFEVELLGNTIKFEKAFRNLDPAQVGIPTLYEFPNTVMLFITAYDPSASSIRRSMLVRNLRVRKGSLAGINAAGSSSQMITFYNPDATAQPPIDVEDGNMWVSEGWYDDGATYVNAAAPDGVLTAFVLGTGNESFSTPTTPVAKLLDSTQVGARQYFAGIFVNGVDVTDSVTFTAGTSTITFSTAPAALAKLVAVYAVAAGNTAPCTYQGANPSLPSQLNYSWDSAAQ